MNELPMNRSVSLGLGRKLVCLAVLVTSVQLSGCVGLFARSDSVYSRDGAPKKEVDVSAIGNAKPKNEPIKRAGNKTPYRVLGKTYRINFDRKGFSHVGYASWYGNKFHGNKTANGEIYDMFAMTAAHKTLPIPTYVKVTNLANRKSIVVRINDRGPFHEGRIIDLSYVAAKKIGMIEKGTAKVKVEVVLPEPPKASRPVGTSRYPKTPFQFVKGSDNYIQVGAFKWQLSAQELLEKVQGLTQLESKILQMKQSGLYKVYVGPIGSQSQLNQLQNQLYVNGIEGFQVIRKPAN